MEDKNPKGELAALFRQIEFILGATKTGLDIIDSDYNIRYIDPEWAKVYGDPAGKKCYEYFMERKELCPGCGVTKALKTKKPVVTEEVLVREGNRPIQVTTIPFQDEKGQWLVAEVNVDISYRKEIEGELKQAKEHAERLYNVVPSAIFTVDKQRHITSWNNKAAEITGYSAEEMIGKECFIFAEQPCKDKCGLYADDVSKPIFGKECTVKRKDGKLAIISKNADFLQDPNGNIIGGIESFEDITDRKHIEEEVAKYREHLEELVKERTDELNKKNKEIIRTNKKLKLLSLRDSHTGLYNHRYFMEVIEVEFERARRNGQPLSAMMLDIDYFKSINDVYGHQFGDLILKQFARQLKRLVRRYDIVIRYGGEEFIIVSPGTKRSDILNLAQRILDALNLYNFGDKKHTVKLKLSIAVASYPDDNVINGAGLMGLTDQILNMVKEAGGNRIYSSLDIGEKKALSLEESTDVKFMEGKIGRLTRRANQSLVEAIFAFAKTIELKDRYTSEHGEKTVQFATSIARELDLSKYEIELIRQAAILHDLGKIGISEKILLKKGKLTKEEFDEIKKHPQIAADILRPIQFLHPLIPLILHHHERWDGKGYPRGLKEEQIPIGARVLSLADHYQALLSDRPYRKAFSKKEAVKIIKRGFGTQYCPKVINAFLKILKKEK